MKREILIISIIIVILIMLLWIYFILENTTLEIYQKKIYKKNLPEGFNNYKIAHISDFHNPKSDKLKNSILESLEKEKPDILVITGDLIDSYHTNIEISRKFISKIKDIPIYYVAGNHESRIKEYSKFKKDVKKLGVQVLENEMISLTKGKNNINLIGIQDPSFETEERNTEEMSKIVDKHLKKFVIPNNFEILLIHRPELFDVYVQNDIDLVFSGHAHGGQFRIPLIGPLVAPNQGLFPKLTEGIHHKGNTDLVISRGIGNSKIPVRFNNKPQLVYITLEKPNKSI